MILGIPWWAWAAWCVLAAGVGLCIGLIVYAGIAAKAEEKREQDGDYVERTGR